MSDQAFDANTDLTNFAMIESGRLGELSAGDQTAARMVATIAENIGKVSQITRAATAEADRLKADDLMNPDGKARLLDELPKNVEVMTYGFLENAETAIVILESRLTSVALAHDPLKSGISDTILTAELQNHVAAIKPDDGAVALVRLAVNPRYATFMAGPYGESLAARFGTDPQSLRRAALQTIAEHGNPSQRAAAVALGKLSKATRVHALSKAGTQNAVKRIRQRS
jgi:hypothetical protein